MKRNPFWLGAVLLAAVCFCGSARAEVRLWPIPEQEPVSEFWKVTVNGKEAGVLTARTCDPPFEKYDFGGEYAILSLDADEPVTLNITKTGDAVENVTIRPESLRMKAGTEPDGTFTVTVDRPCKFSVEYDGRVHPLLVFVNPLETEIPSENDPGTIYFGPGIHYPENGVVTLHDNQTLYLAAGAVLHGGVEVFGKNIRILGRGIIDYNDWTWGEAAPTGHVVHMQNAENVTLDGVIIRGACRWTVVPINCSDVTIHNIKICGGRAQNDDGINPCNSRRVSISDSFIRTDDDCVAIKGIDTKYGNCEDITVERVVFWCDRARIVLMGHESSAPYMRRITFRDCDIIHSRQRNFLLEPGENMHLDDVTLDNIRYEIEPEFAMTADEIAGVGTDISRFQFDRDQEFKENWLVIARPAVNMYMKVKEPGYINNLTVKNLKVTGGEAFCGICFSGMGEDHKAVGIRIENIDLFGQKLTYPSARFLIGGDIEDWEVK